MYHLKRAQIFVADVWGAFEGKGIGNFNDISKLTMFADYIVPAVLKNWGVLKYSPELERKINEGEEIVSGKLKICGSRQIFYFICNFVSGSEEEVEIRSCCITTTELLREKMKENGLEVSDKSFIPVS